jgi:DNA-binding response OmpR family regulator
VSDLQFSTKDSKKRRFVLLQANIYRINQIMVYWKKSAFLGGIRKMERILLVEDDRSLREDLSKVLIREGYECDACGSILSARPYIGREYGLYILDVLLPDGDGIGFCRELRKNGNAPVLFLTACDDEAHTVNGLDAGGDGYVTKPFRLKELLSRIRALLRRTSMEPDASLSCGRICASPRERKAYEDGVPLNLTRTEMDLMLLFMRHPGQVLTRPQLLSRLWDDSGEFVDDNTLSVHISHLREKIQSLPLQTVRGVGYMWDAKVGRAQP